MPTEDYANLEFLDRDCETLIEFQLTYQALATNGARIDEVVSLLSESGYGDEASRGRVVRAAGRLVDEGVLVEKSEVYKLTPTGEEDVRRLANLLQQLVPDEVPSAEEADRGLTPET